MPDTWKWTWEGSSNSSIGRTYCTRVTGEPGSAPRNHSATGHIVAASQAGGNRPYGQVSLRLELCSNGLVGRFSTVLETKTLCGLRGRSSNGLLVRGQRTAPALCTEGD